jgi:drug/metabolite transporter (DMT)-like permease
MKQSYLKGVLSCLLATVSWGAMFPVMTSALRHLDAFSFTALRYSLAACAFVALLLVREGRGALNLRGERVGLLWLLGSCGFAGFGFLVFLGQRIAGPSGALTASILMATMPMLGLLVNWALRGVRPGAPSFGFILLSFFGVLLVLSKGDPGAILRAPSDYGANVPIVLGALCWVIYTVGASYFPSFSPIRYTTLTTLLGLTTVYVVVAILIVSGVITPSLDEALGLWPHFLYMAFVAGFLGVLSWNTGNKIISPLNGMLFMDIVPITAFTVSLFLGVIPTGGQLLGASITASALVLNNLYLRARLAPKVSPVPAATARMAVD